MIRRFKGVNKFGKKSLHQKSNVANRTTRVCAFLVFQNTMQYEKQCRLFTDHFWSFSCILILVKSFRTMITYYCSHCIILCGLRTLQLHHCSTVFLSLNCITLKNNCLWCHVFFLQLNLTVRCTD